MLRERAAGWSRGVGGRPGPTPETDLPTTRDRYRTIRGWRYRVGLVGCRYRTIRGWRRRVSPEPDRYRTFHGSWRASPVRQPDQTGGVDLAPRGCLTTQSRNQPLQPDEEAGIAEVILYERLGGLEIAATLNYLGVPEPEHREFMGVIESYRPTVVAASADGATSVSNGREHART